jgi:hypothetical protein
MLTPIPGAGQIESRPIDQKSAGVISAPASHSKEVVSAEGIEPSTY